MKTKFSIFICLIGLGVSQSFAQITASTVVKFKDTVMTEIWQDLKGTVLENAQVTEKTYDAKKNNTVALFKTWKSEAWINNSQEVYSYNEKNVATAKLRQYWDKSQSAWMNDNQTTWTYDAAGNLVTELYQKWDLN
ncbi:MAG: hypothetical protein IAF38_06890, partial [Bacteroidia bacterium]|nr:hypothetical protein [Bacteroidia bacterium]